MMKLMNSRTTHDIIGIHIWLLARRINPASHLTIYASIWKWFYGVLYELYCK